MLAKLFTAANKLKCTLLTSVLDEICSTIELSPVWISLFLFFFQHTVQKVTRQTRQTVCNVASERTDIHVLLYIAFCSGLGHQHIMGADGSRYQSVYEPTEPSQPMRSDDVSDEDRPQHRELRPLLSNN